MTTPRIAALFLSVAVALAGCAGNAEPVAAPTVVTTLEEGVPSTAPTQAPTGEPGPSGEASTGETPKWVVTDYAGAKVRASGVTAFTKLGTGRWEVTFGSDVSKCAYVATIADPADKLVYNPGLVFAAGGHNSDRGVYVETKNLGGGLADFPYHLWVRCSNSDRWVVSDYAGNQVRAANVNGFHKLGVGRWEVTFSSNVRGCAYLATIADPAKNLVYNPGLVFAAGGHSSPNGVYIETKNLGGGLADYPWHLQVRCTGSAQWVVSDYAGAKVRGANVVSFTKLGTGRWEVTFNKDLRGCAYLATVADPADKLVYNPGLVFTASGHNGPNGVYVETKNLGGGLADFPYHLNVVCT